LPRKVGQSIEFLHRTVSGKSPSASRYGKFCVEGVKVPSLQWTKRSLSSAYSMHAHPENSG